jgi:hypothetical protein
MGFLGVLGKTRVLAKNEVFVKNDEKSSFLRKSVIF